MIERIVRKIAPPYLRLVCDYCGFNTGPHIDQSGGAAGIRKRHNNKYSSNRGRPRKWPVVRGGDNPYDFCSDYCKERHARENS